MLRKFFVWLEQRTCNAICEGCRKAVQDLSGGKVEIEAGTALLTDETEAAEPLPKPAKKAVKKKRANRK